MSDAHIFLPAAGYRNYYVVRYAYGYYWSSSLYADEPFRAWYVDFYSDGVHDYGCSRYCGQSVRAVIPGNK